MAGFLLFRVIADGNLERKVVPYAAGGISQFKMSGLFCSPWIICLPMTVSSRMGRTKFAGVYIQEEINFYIWCFLAPWMCSYVRDALQHTVMGFRDESLVNVSGGFFPPSAFEKLVKVATLRLLRAFMMGHIAL